MWQWNCQMWVNEKNKETIEYEKKKQLYGEKKNNVIIEPSNVSKNKNKRTAKYDKSMVSCNIDIAQCNPEKVLL